MHRFVVVAVLALAGCGQSPEEYCSDHRTPYILGKDEQQKDWEQRDYARCVSDARKSDPPEQFSSARP